MTMRKATHRYRRTIGSCYLTHGSDSYDKRALRKVRRQLDRAHIQEQLEERRDEEECDYDAEMCWECE